MINKLLHQEFAVEFFKKLSATTCETFGQEMAYLRKQNYFMRTKYIEAEKKILTLLRFISKQENQMSHVRAYMKKATEEINATIDRNQPEITQQYLNSLPDSLKLSASEEINPFALYTSYLKLNKPIAYSVRVT